MGLSAVHIKTQPNISYLRLHENAVPFSEDALPMLSTPGNYCQNIFRSLSKASNHWQAVDKELKRKE
jgi:hypothetical protein